MLITNKQAIICSTVFGSMLQKAGVMTNVYELCDVDLKDFSLQGDLLVTVSVSIACTRFYISSDLNFFFNLS